MNTDHIQHETPHQEMWVVFSGETDLPWLKMLKPGFRHCFVLINDGQRWMSVDPLSSHTEVLVYHHVMASFDLPSWLESRGYTTLQAGSPLDHKRAAPLMMFSCVEAVKRLLGIHKRFILTPWQLYQFLKSREEKKSAQYFYGRSEPINHNQGEYQWQA